jgi:hypothetical protein
MPAKREWTAEDLAARLEREREQARGRMARMRSRNRSRNTTAVTVTAEGLSAHAHEGTNGRSTAFLVTPSLSEKEEVTSDFEQVRCVLEPLKGYQHDEQLLARLAATCPAVDLVLEAIGMAEWLQRTANRKRVCSKAFLSNWVKRAATRTEPTGQLEPASAPRPAPRSALGRVLQQIADDPVAGPSTWH